MTQVYILIQRETMDNGIVIETIDKVFINQRLAHEEYHARKQYLRNNYLFDRYSVVLRYYTADSDD